ncbi:YafY family protein [Acinetobacter sp. ANC 4177]|jgi:predicted DNA-binding transcriptional regulator YafY|uniref:helix-turn-helix transcriptional regulator n=1 Tax=Acinetobacter sp. ANC 4177 TaxID=2529838 RepID=UPI00103903CC|nr:YafY family protein [Acinetobacter sp. ANC 4177]TCB76801.1 YafY family transcriptional regulator [Acinetobacter sp. ANC 4177]
MKIKRLLSIIDMLTARRTSITATMLASKHGVSVRTIYRDILDLRDAGIPIDGEAGIGYQLGQGYFLPTFHFDYDEIDSMLIGLQLIHSIIENESLSQAAHRVLNKISVMMESRNKHYVLNSPFKSVSHKMDSFSSNKHFDIIRQAIRENRYLYLNYIDIKKSLSSRNVRPLGLTFFDEAWLLTAWCEVKQDFRNFRLDQILECELMDQYFFNDPSKTFKDYIKTL